MLAGHHDMLHLGAVVRAAVGRACTKQRVVWNSGVQTGACIHLFLGQLHATLHARGKPHLSKRVYGIIHSG